MCDYHSVGRRLITNMLITVLHLSLILHSGLAVVILQSGDQVTHKGITVTLECSMGQGLSMGSHTMYWYRQNHHGAPVEFLSKEYDTTVGHFQSSIDTSKNSFSLQITELLLNDTSTYYCAASHSDAHRPDSHTNTKGDSQCDTGSEAYFGKGTKLTVLEKGREVTPPTNENVKVFGPSSFECRKPKDDERKKTLLCVVSGFYPDHVSVFWQVNGKNKTKGVATDNAAQWTDSSTEFYRITSRLRVPADDWNNPKNEFTCIISFFSGTDTTHYQNSIRGVEAQTKGVMTRDNYLRITQSAKLSYGIFIIKSTIYGAFVALVVWKLQGSTGKQNH
ncbi:T cell receptor beta chain MC.7.G5-like [Trachinotus anak]|uniref:T cell receptor beta chain MC.7.G5-like n=1 Tax=Trachinotus anak TaxID=443729 RepID=UPI0039F1BC4D